MNAVALYAELIANGVELALEGDNLRYRASQGVLNETLLQQLREHKAALLHLLNPVRVVTAADGTVYQTRLYTCPTCQTVSWATNPDAPDGWHCQVCAALTRKTKESRGRQEAAENAAWRESVTQQDQ